MKKILILFFVLTASIIQAQKKQAQKTTDKLTEVMGLSKEQSATLLTLNTERFEKRKELKKEYAGNNEGFKAAALLVEKEYNKKLRKLIDKEQMKKLVVYRKKLKELRKKG